MEEASIPVGSCQPDACIIKEGKESDYEAVKYRNIAPLPGL